MKLFHCRTWIRSVVLIAVGMAVILAITACNMTGNVTGNQTRDPQNIIEELVVDYGNYGDKADARLEELLKELESADANLGVRWRKIADLWEHINSDQQINFDVLPDGLSDTEELCIVALGFQLEADGSMREELVERLKVVLNSAKKYPAAYVLCTGGGTASKNEAATEAGEMAKWLIANGVDKKRVIVEDRSITTAQNAIFTYDILTTQYPKVKQIAIISSDYHLATGELLFTAESILRAGTPGSEKIEVVSNAAYKAPSGSLSSMFQAGALIELSGDTETAFEIYYDTYDIHALPPLTGVDESTTEATTDASGETETASLETAVVLGDEQFDAYIPLLEGKRVALFSNHTGIVGDQTSGIGTPADGEDVSLIPFGQDAAGNEITYGEHILDALLSHGVNVTAIFSPEHGFRGTEDAGATVDNSVDEKTGVPILSLYADDETHSPAPESMEQFDVMLVDMQDVGLRYYTYYLSMYYLMDACAAADKEFIILDRPNPNGFYVDGPILKVEYKSNVGQLPIPVVYGMTWGELAQMINGEGWLTAGKEACALTVIPCQNYTHQTKTGLIRNPSPNIKDMRAVYLYASTCFFENTAVSVGRGTEFPFEAYGSPYLKGIAGYDFAFTPVSMAGATEPPFMDETCYGVDLRDVPLSEIWDNQINLDYLVGAYQAVKEAAPDVSFWGTPDDKGLYWIDKLTGSNEVRLQIEEGRSAEEIKDGWQDEIHAFLEQRKPYLLYAE